MNLSTQRIQNAVVRNSIFQANTYGILLAYPDDLDVDIGPYSVDIEHVTIIGNNSDGIIMGRPSPNMTIRDSLIIDNGDYGVRGAIGSFSVDRNVMGHTAFWGNGKGARTGWTQLGVGTLTNVQPVLRTTNPSSPYFLYLDSSNPDSILHGSRNGTFLGARPVYPIPEPDTTSTMSTACCMLALPMPSRGCKEQRGGAIDGCLVLHTIHHKFTRSHE
ncbi:MAG: right-handed parallel beta-helix repeat-containing protein [Pirellulales bacterium]|nr:right-handed parallel beta-helix repeat-containing protein [Pirellulales bacterium]